MGNNLSKNSSVKGKNKEELDNRNLREIFHDQSHYQPDEETKANTEHFQPSYFYQSGQVRDYEAIAGTSTQTDYEDFHSFGQASSVSPHSFKDKDTERRPRSSSLLDDELPSYSSRTIGPRSPGARPIISRRTSLSDKRDLININDQISLINLTRTHQTEQRGEQGQFYPAPPPRVSPIRLDSLSHLPRLNHTLNESIQWFRSPEGRNMNAKNSGISIPPPAPPQSQISRRHSQLSVSVYPDEIKEDSESPTRSIIKTSRKLVCRESEAYIKWRAKKSSSIKKIVSQFEQGCSNDELEDFPIDSLSDYYHLLTESSDSTEDDNFIPGVSYSIGTRESSRELCEDEITVETVEDLETEGAENPKKVTP
ncbi:hypothetical protein K3495_g9662 [Podosphaera aphanis]|nr:hypothetical protein K3495_g9662 [Podosphaera aphanis]